MAPKRPYLVRVKLASRYVNNEDKIIQYNHCQSGPGYLDTYAADHV